MSTQVISSLVFVALCNVILAFDCDFKKHKESSMVKGNAEISSLKNMRYVAYFSDIQLRIIYFYEKEQPQPVTCILQADFSLSFF